MHQLAIAPGGQVLDAVMSIRYLLYTATEWDLEVYILQLDVAKAFDRADFFHLDASLYSHGVSLALRLAFFSLDGHMHLHMQLQGVVADYGPLRRALLQG
eukprot:6387490-Amphidinium_carterae.1